MVRDGEILFYGTPESVTIEVIEQLLVNEGIAKPLTAKEIKEKGMEIGDSPQLIPQLITN